VQAALYVIVELAALALNGLWRYPLWQLVFRVRRQAAWACT
jgi:hypothetical protein